jgi:glycerol-3-phosphate dehydrogenase (NAD(P)+)
MSTPVAVLGAGSFGRGLAHAAARVGRDVIIFSRVETDVGIDRVTTTNRLADLARAELIFVAVPSQHIEEVARDLGEHIDGRHLLVHVSRGLAGPDLTPLTRVLRELTPCRRVGALAGPLVADALTEGRTGGAIVGTRFPEIANAVRDAIGGPMLRIYSTDDVHGVEVASAMVGLLTLTGGFARHLGMGPAALAVMATRGLAEAARLGVALGALERTFYGLAGTGDLMAVLAGDDRPELRLAAAVAEGKSIEQATEAAGSNIESMELARRVADYADRAGVSAPIAEAMAEVLDGRCTPSDAVTRLMTRRMGTE